jgi:signal transduction histidine kinase
VKVYSLTRRLITAVLIVEFCSVLALIGIVSTYEAVSSFRALDVTLRGRADSLLGAVQDAEDPQDNVMLDGTQGLTPKHDIYVVRDERGRLLGSYNWPGGEQLAASSDAKEFRDLTVSGVNYRVIRKLGLRMVDPGDAGGGIARHVVILYGSRTHPVWEQVRNAVLFFTGAGLVLLAITAWILFHLLRRGLRPLYELADQAGRISVNSWSLGPSSQARYVRELTPLVSAIESSLDGLEHAFMQQRQFVSDAAHELKTSVAVLKSSLQVLTMRSRSAKEYEAGLERVQLDSERMEELVARMLTLARLEEEPQQPELMQVVELANVLHDVVDQFQTLAEMTKVHIVVHTETPARIQAAPDQLHLLCSNLLQNALQHSPSGSEVRAMIFLRGTVAELRIEDDGDGIPPEILPHVFDRFYRGDPSRSRRTGGTGLGLAISRAVVVRCQGEIRLESTPGRGTNAVALLPLAAKRSQPEAIDSTPHRAGGAVSS